LEEFKATLQSVDGKCLSTYDGTANKMNEQFKDGIVLKLPAGFYTLKTVSKSSAKIQIFKLAKQ